MHSRFRLHDNQFRTAILNRQECPWYLPSLLPSPPTGDSYDASFTTHSDIFSSRSRNHNLKSRSRLQDHQFRYAIPGRKECPWYMPSLLPSPPTRDSHVASHTTHSDFGNPDTRLVNFFFLTTLPGVGCPISTFPHREPRMLTFSPPGHQS